MKKTITAICLLLVAVTSFAAEGRWKSDWGQGDSTYYIDSKGIRLNITCPTNPETFSAVSLYRVSDNRQAESFTIKVGKDTFYGPFNSGTRNGGNDFISLIKALRKSGAVVKVGNITLKYPRSNAAKVLPVHGSPAFDCTVF